MVVLKVSFAKSNVILSNFGSEDKIRKNANRERIKFYHGVAAFKLRVKDYTLCLNTIVQITRLPLNRTQEATCIDGVS